MKTFLTILTAAAIVLICWMVGILLAASLFAMSAHAELDALKLTFGLLGVGAFFGWAMLGGVMAGGYAVDRLAK